jgi:hypothetical protein
MSDSSNSKEVLVNLLKGIIRKDSKSNTEPNSEQHSEPKETQPTLYTEQNQFQQKSQQQMSYPSDNLLLQLLTYYNNYNQPPVQNNFYPNVINNNQYFNIFPQQNIQQFYTPQQFAMMNQYMNPMVNWNNYISKVSQFPQKTVEEFYPLSMTSTNEKSKDNSPLSYSHSVNINSV